MERTHEHIAESIKLISQEQVHRRTAEQNLRDHGGDAKDTEADLWLHIQILTLYRFCDNAWKESGRSDAKRF